MTEQPQRPEFPESPDAARAQGNNLQPRQLSADEAPANYDQEVAGRRTAATAARTSPTVTDNSSIFRTMALGLLVLALFIVAMLILWGCNDDSTDVVTDDSAASEGEDADDADSDSDDADADADADSDSDSDEGADADSGDEDSEDADAAEDEDSAEDADAGDPAPDPVEEAQMAASVNAEIGADEVILTGVVADLSTKGGIVEAATAEFAPRTIVDELELDAQVAQAEEPGELVVTGEVGTEGRKSSVLASATAVSDAAGGLSIVDEVTVAESGSANAVAAEITELFTAEPVQFDSGSSTIRAESFPTLDQAAELLVAAPDIRIEIGGHTDDDGDADSNAELSKDRAEAVTAYLLTKGASAEQMLARGYGQARPIASNETDEGKALNRRIEARPL